MAGLPPWDWLQPQPTSMGANSLSFHVLNLLMQSVGSKRCLSPFARSFRFAVRSWSTGAARSLVMHDAAFWELDHKHVVRNLVVELERVHFDVLSRRNDELTVARRPQNTLEIDFAGKPDRFAAGRPISPVRRECMTFVDSGRGIAGSFGDLVSHEQ